MSNAVVRGRRMLALSALFACVQTTLGLAAAPDGLIQNVWTREHKTLHGSWRAIVDPYDTGYYNYRQRPDANGFFKNRKTKSPSDLVEYDFDASDTLKVPGDFNTQRDELMYYEGSVWYKRTFTHETKPERRAVLHVGAANYDARVYLNGEFIGRHVGGYTAFQFEVTDKLRAGENDLIVQVNNNRQRSGVPTINRDWWNYGGLTREVLLLDLPKTFIRDYRIRLDADTGRQLLATVQLDGDRLEQNVRLSFPAIGISAEARTDAAGRCSFKIPADRFARWSPGSPKLHDVVIQCETDEVRDKIGLRTIAVRGRDIFLNDEPIFLRGICLHEESLADRNRAWGEEDARALLDVAKELGCNFVRLAHYPHNEAMLREADRLGLMVWAEIPVYWTIDWENPKTYQLAVQQLREMIDRDKNRAAVIMWSVGNETPRSAARLQFMTNLVKAARRLDDSRLVVAALETKYVNPKTIKIDDPLGAQLDVLGCNEYIGWYDGLPGKGRNIRWTTDYDKPLIISEFGAGALNGYHGPPNQRWTEEFQAAVYRDQLEMLDKIDFLRGMTPWILKDFRSPRRLLPRIQDGWNRKGLISETGEKKAAFGILQAYYKRRDRSHADATK